jgi:hypothetical protein
MGAPLLGAIFIAPAASSAHHPRHTRQHITMNLTKALGAAGALLLAALLGGTLIGSALATDATDATDSTDTGTSGAVLADSDAAVYCDVFLDALAAELGTTRDALTAAGRTAAGAAIDAAVEAGDLTEDRAADIRERIENADGDGCGLIGAAWGRGFAHGMGAGTARGLLGGDIFEAAADALGIEGAELIGQFRDAGSLENLAGTHGVAYDDVKAAVLAAVQADLDAAVAEGLDQERADQAIERLTAWLDDGGQAGEFRFGGPGGHHGPWGGPRGDDGTESDEDDASS